MKRHLLSLTISLLTISASSQKYFTKTGIISFEASTALEDVSATNKSATSVIDAASGKLEFAVLIKGFEFGKDLMQEHFNENYMESTQYPKATFKGVFAQDGLINFQKPGSYPATVKGTITIHGVQKEITATGIIKVTSQGLQISSKFSLSVNDFKIAIPGIVKDKISPIAKVSVNGNYLPLNK